MVQLQMLLKYLQVLNSFVFKSAICVLKLSKSPLSVVHLILIILSAKSIICSLNFSRTSYPVICWIRQGSKTCKLLPENFVPLSMKKARLKHLRYWLGLLKIYYIILNWFYVWYEAEIYTRDNPWQQLLTNDVMTLVTWPMYILLTRDNFCWYQQKWENDDVMSVLLLSRGLSGESFYLIPLIDPKTWRRPYFCL